ncbi:MAG TPA: tryptophan--tRNA ligase [Candidatus Bathyarchaeia archaeon]|nr:tryptophan--tRNA ligase [Candidatus Bathyarchaeia archaeon]
MTEQMNLSIDTFAGKIIDYERAMLEFGIQDISKIVDSLPEGMGHKYLRRGLMFGHTDAEKIFEAARKKNPFAVMTGIKPTGQYHIGSLITCNEVLYFQSLGGKVYFCIADMESYLHNGVPLAIAHQTAIDNIADILALGLDSKNAIIYKQSEEKTVLRLASQFSRNVTYNMMKAIYGEQSFGAYQSALIQVGDILLPQLIENEGPIVTVTPVGLEQAPHTRLTRDIARKQEHQEEFGFIMPSFTFHKILGSLNGGEKMSKSAGNDFILTLSETENSLKNKIARVFTGGRDTKEEQRKLGGQISICRVFDLFKFYFTEDDKELAKRVSDCTSGTILCGECKKDLLNCAVRFITKHQQIKESKIDLAKQLVEEDKK